ncbi:MAG: DUF1385 domain-containing protein [Clostridia bacterium]|nr:DUF1385 domain-containing protein [Clostridia bacterium]
MSDRKDEPKVCRLNRVGGQAVLEGVMMKAGERTVTSCRNEQGEIVVQDGSFVSVRKKHRILDLPIIRGFVNFIEMMVLSFKTLGFSAEVMGIDDEEEKKKKEAEGKKSNTVDIIMFFSIILGILLAVGLFFILPAYAAKGICWLFNLFVPSVAVPSFAVAIIEGIMKMIILLTYLALVTLMPDIRRTFQYHGAEHKSIACFEAGDELTPENAMKHRRFHPRCGTSFMFLMILIGIFVGMFVRFILPPEEAFAFSWLHPLLVSAIKILLLPLTMGIGYEILMLAGKHDNIVTRIISAPGMWVQRITTKEPTPEMLEIAITSIKCALRDDFPEFMEFYNSRGWEKKAENTEETVEIADDATEAAEPAEAATDGQTEPLTSEDNENSGIADTASEQAE